MLPISTQNVPNDPVDRVIARILDRNTPLSLTKALAAENITAHGFNKLLSQDREKALAYARALELRADLLADETVDIADTDEDPSRARNRIEARKWLASKHNKRYGERVDLNVNQTIDVSATLAEARTRLLRPVRDQLEASDAQVLDIPTKTINGSSDKQSVDAPLPGAAPDIFD